MGSKPIFGMLCLALTVGAAWWYLKAPNRLLPWRAAPEAPSASAAGLRKCVVDGRVLYTNADGVCPTGSRERPLTGGSVSVMTSPRTAPLSGSGASAVPNVRDMLLDPRAVDIKDKRMEEAIGR